MFKQILALAYMRQIEAKSFVSKHKISKAYDKLWEGLDLVVGLEFDLYPEKKEQLMPLRLILEKQQNTLINRLNTHVFPNRNFDLSVESIKFWDCYHKTIQEFKKLIGEK